MFSRTSLYWATQPGGRAHVFITQSRAFDPAWRARPSAACSLVRGGGRAGIPGAAVGAEAVVVVLLLAVEVAIVVDVMMVGGVRGRQPQVCDLD